MTIYYVNGSLYETPIPSECRIPLLVNWKMEGTMIFQEEVGFGCEEETEIGNVIDGAELFRPIQSTFFENPFDPIQSVLSQIQRDLDSRHSKK